MLNKNANSFVPSSSSSNRKKVPNSQSRDVICLRLKEFMLCEIIRADRKSQVR